MKCCWMMLRIHSTNIRHTTLISKLTWPVLFTSASCRVAISSTHMTHARSSRSSVGPGSVDAALVLLDW
jgi:hypothetical protein